MDLRNKIAVITGGSKGIGKAIAIALAAEGCRIAISARDPDDLKKAEKDVARVHKKIISVKADVREWKDVERLSRTVEDKWGPPHILVNNAGIGRFNEVLKMREQDFRETLETNLIGAFHCTKAFLPGMIENQEGHIINIGSLAGKNSFAGGSAYCASKHALISFGECLMMEVRHHNIKVTTVCPGTVQTNFNPSTAEKSWALTAEDVGKAVVDVLTSSAGALISMVDLRPLQPPRR